MRLAAPPCGGFSGVPSGKFHALFGMSIIDVWRVRGACLAKLDVGESKEIGLDSGGALLY